MEPRRAEHRRPMRLRQFVVLSLAALLTGCQTSGPPIVLPTPILDAPGESPVQQAVHHEAPAPPPQSPPLPAALSGPVSLSIQEAVRFALANNPRLREAVARARAAEAGADIAFAPFLPQFDGGYRASTFNVPVLPGGSFVPASLTAGANSFMLAELGAQWTIYDFGRTGGRYGQAVCQARIEKLNLQRARQTVAFEVVRAYLQSLYALANQRVREQAVRQAEAVLQDTQARRQAGVADREAVLRADVELSAAREELVAARQLVADAVSTLNVVLGRSAVLPVKLTDVAGRPPLMQSLEEALQKAVAGRPEVEIGRETVAEAGFGVKAARGELLPRIYVRSTVIYTDSNGPIGGWVTGSGLHVEQALYGGGRRLAEVRRQQAQAALASAGLQSILDNISQQVNLAFQAIATQQERIRLGETGVAQARENLRLTLVKYNNGDATPTSVVDAQTALTRAQTRYFSALYEYLEGLSRLEYAQGGDQTCLLGQLAPAPESPKEESPSHPKTQ